MTLSYDGSGFAGWQRQKNAPSVQATLETALQKLLHHQVHVTGAGRTDTGVHALGQVAHIRTTSTIPMNRLQQALNAILPRTLVIQSIRTAPGDFHAQHSAKLKHYRYTIWNSPIRPLLERAHILHVPYALNLTLMRHAARTLQGRHNFRAFHTSGRTLESHTRNLYSLTIRRQPPYIWIDAKADGFLYHMVRRLVGLLLDIGRGKYPAAIAKQMLHHRTKFIAHTVPAHGLCLVKVQYA